jgi:2-beta-glucuronyltransferase
MGKKKVVLLTGHYYNSKRKAGFHFLADAFEKNGFEVTFITSVVSLLTFLKRDHKIYEDGFIKNIFKTNEYNGIKSVINFSFLHPVDRNSNFLEYLGNLFFKLNKISKKEIVNADYIIFESTPSLLFFGTITKLNSKAKLIYRMSDDIEVLKQAKMVIKYEREILSKFDLISIPTKFMYDKFNKLSPTNTKLHFHGIDKELYDSCSVSPYKNNTINHIFVGNSYLDEKFIDIASKLFPQHLFHIIGPFEKNIINENVIYYGQMPFSKTIPYVKFASSGLQIMDNTGGAAETLADSLKVLQYSYCKLPIIAPSVIPAFHRENFFYYEYDDEKSIEKCINEILEYNNKKNICTVHSWTELIERFLI